MWACGPRCWSSVSSNSLESPTQSSLFTHLSKQKQHPPRFSFWLFKLQTLRPQASHCMLVQQNSHAHWCLFELNSSSYQVSLFNVNLSSHINSCHFFCASQTYWTPLLTFLKTVNFVQLFSFLKAIKGPNLVWNTSRNCPGSAFP